MLPSRVISTLMVVFGSVKDLWPPIDPTDGLSLAGDTSYKTFRGTITLGKHTSDAAFISSSNDTHPARLQGLHDQASC